MLKRLIFGVALAACVGAAAPPSVAQVGVSVRIGPPAPLVERIPAAPGPRYYWRAGHWSWNGARYVWLPGGYAVRPYRNAVWIPGHWRQGPHRWVWTEGHWGRA